MKTVLTFVIGAVVGGGLVYVYYTKIKAWTTTEISKLKSKLL